MESIYTKLALYGSKYLCAKADNVFFHISEVCDGTVSLVKTKIIAFFQQRKNIFFIFSDIWGKKVISLDFFEIFNLFLIFFFMFFRFFRVFFKDFILYFLSLFLPEKSVSQDEAPHKN